MNYNPDNFTEEKKTVWSFKNRGSWATHSGNYRGNWSPFVPRNIILKYSKEKDWVLDQFCGSGTTLVEAKLLNRNSIGVDINKSALSLSKNNLDFDYPTDCNSILLNGDARDLRSIKDSSIDLICTHLPYADIIKYSKDIAGDLSLFTIEEFIANLSSVANECIRVLKKGCKCAVMIGDVRRNRKLIPLGFHCLNRFLETGFLLKEIVIKEQHNCLGTKFWENKSNNFLLLAHEYIFILEK